MIMYNQFGYNPYLMANNGQQPIPQPMQNPIQNSAVNSSVNRQVLNGKLVDGIEMVKSIEYPLDGSISYFPTTDGSAIVTKQLMQDGTSKITVYRPVVEENKEIKYITQDDMKKAIDGLNLDKLEDIEEDVKDLKQEFKEFKKKKKDD